MAGKTLYDKLWEMHEVSRRDDGSSLLYIDRHILHEVTSPQAFEGLRLAGRKPWRVDANLANLHLGEALAHAGQKQEATDALNKVTGPNQALAQYWAIYANKGSAPAAPASAAR